MAKLYGVVIADPAKKNLKFSRIEHDHYDVTRKLPGKPQGKFVSEQDKLNNFDRLSSSSREVYTAKEVVVPITNVVNNKMITLTNVRRANLKADVEIPQLEADKKLVDQDINSGAWFDPKSNYPVPTTKVTSRPVLRIIRDQASVMSNENGFAKQTNYLYKKDSKSFQDTFYKNNPWKLESGRVCLFESRFTRIF